MQALYTHEDIFHLPITFNGEEAVCVTTNGVIKKDGKAVMGKGIAKEADGRYDLAGILATRLKETGNHVYPLKKIEEMGRSFWLFSFPTKHDWRDNSDLSLIVQSAWELVNYCNQWGIRRCYLTPPGCANGKLDWEAQVKPELEKIFDDRFTIVIRR